MGSCSKSTSNCTPLFKVLSDLKKEEMGKACQEDMYLHTGLQQSTKLYLVSNIQQIHLHLALSLLHLWYVEEKMLTPDALHTIAIGCLLENPQAAHRVDFPQKKHDLEAESLCKYSQGVSKKGSTSATTCKAKNTAPLL